MWNFVSLRQLQLGRTNLAVTPKTGLTCMPDTDANGHYFIYTYTVEYTHKLVEDKLFQMKLCDITESDLRPIL